MKISIITFQFARNYGAALQAYALKKKLEQLSQKCEIINYAPPAERIQLDTVLLPTNGIKPLIVNLFSLLHYKKLKICCAKFKDFAKEHFNLTKPYGSLQELQKVPPEADIYICGSDQVWNCSQEFAKPYFLDFGDEKIKRISYAASIGIKEIPDKFKDLFATSLKRFDFVSVREESAQMTLNNLSDIACEVVLDPVFLLSKEQWQTLQIKSEITKQYILVYSLSTPQLLNDALIQLKKATGFQIIEICSTGFSKVHSDKRLYDVGPCEFLGLIGGAAFVVTSSFHGTAFSLIYQKNFYSYCNSVTGNRTRDLLKKFGLEDRIINNIVLEEIGKNSVIYENVVPTLKSEIENVNLFLETVLK